MPSDHHPYVLPSFVLEEGMVLARKYRLVRTAGFGGMAQLWVAMNEATGAEVCIKILVPEMRDDESVARFRREAYAAARLSHRAIVRIFDLVELGPGGETLIGGKPSALAIVMELLRGETLADRLMKSGSLPLEETIDIVVPFLSALAHAHRAGVVHRDLKPDNIFLSTDPDGHMIPKVLDFGVSKMSTRERDGGAAPITLEGVTVGTPSYMSPEQACGSRDIDARSDVFSAGTLVYMMLAGHNPFDADSFHGTVTAILRHQPPRLPSIPDPIWEVIEKALSKEAGTRYADATELGIALRRAAGRTSPTDSGVHVMAPPSGSERSTAGVVVPLGGDSIVSVPPVGNVELEDPEAERALRVAAPAARRRATRIVMGVVAGAAALVVVGFLRSPEGSRAANERKTSSAAPLATIELAAVPGNGALAARAEVALAAVEAGAAALPAELAPEAAASPATAAAATQLKPVSTGAPRAAAAPRKAATREPSILRDPGF